MRFLWPLCCLLVRVRKYETIFNFSAQITLKISIMLNSRHNFCTSMITTSTNNKYCPNSINVFVNLSVEFVLYIPSSEETDLKVTYFSNFQIYLELNRIIIFPNFIKFCYIKVTLQY
jgi:hypothetical protein